LKHEVAWAGAFMNGKGVNLERIGKKNRAISSKKREANTIYWDSINPVKEQYHNIKIFKYP
jgi:hypothetical protein